MPGPVPFMPCMICREHRTPWGNECRRCKEVKRRAYLARIIETRGEPDEYIAVKAVRVERYAAIIAAGGRLFEGVPA